MVFGHGCGFAHWAPVSSLPHDDDIRRVARGQYFSSDDQLVTLAMAPRGNQFATLEVTERDYALADELGIRITCHAGDGEWGKGRPIAQLAGARPARPDADLRALQLAGRRRAADDGRRRLHGLDLARHRAADGARLAGDGTAARRGHPPEPLDRRVLLERRPPVRDDARDDRHAARLRQRGGSASGGLERAEAHLPRRARVRHDRGRARRAAWTARSAASRPASAPTSSSFAPTTSA